LKNSGPSLSEVGLRIYLRIRWVRFWRALGKIPTEPAADLRGALNLNVTQLMKTASLKDAQLDEEKAEGMKKKNRDLAEKLLSG